MATFVMFWVLMVATLIDRARRQKVIAKAVADWVLDLAGLAVQGALIPLLQLVVLVQLYETWLPGLGGVWSVPAPVAFTLSFVAVDYLYYWNHRLLHTGALWPVHVVHHTVTDMDVLGTSRNTVWSSFLILYVWVGSVMIHVLADASWYAAGVAATACLDLWRHSAIETRAGGLIDRLLSAVLITPRAHAWHHSTSDQAHNYGANFSLWDRLHGTYRAPGAAPQSLGVPSALSLTQRLVWPFS